MDGKGFPHIPIERVITTRTIGLEAQSTQITVLTQLDVLWCGCGVDRHDCGTVHGRRIEVGEFASASKRHESNDLEE